MIESNEEQEWIELKNNWHALCFKKSKRGEKPRVL
ncbi:hypothetical protein SAMN05720759_10726 [Fibrobacter sp. UWB12]|nr:hypothetical protein SAMN05720759_10726 [Fibrobacter sp. UWB12]